jgi:hypothetical protein
MHSLEWRAVRGGPKTLIVALVVLLLAAGVAACGGGDSSSSTSTEAGQTQAEGNSKSEGSSGGSSKKAAKSGGKEGKSGSEGGEGKAGNTASDFVPKQHHDSGGGSARFKTKGGDNSVQEYGAEADPSERDAAATALHNFFDARAEGNWDAACEYLSKGTIESFEKLAAGAKGVEGKSCGGILEALTNPAAKQVMKTEAAQADVRSLRFEGEQGFLLYTFEGTVYSVPMNKEGGSWKVASLAGVPLS